MKTFRDLVDTIRDDDLPSAVEHTEHAALEEIASDTFDDGMEQHGAKPEPVMFVCHIRRRPPRL